jgi:hypothetical protein
MKHILMALCLALTTSCAFHTAYGECIGVLDEEQANLQYHYPVRNIIWTALSPWTIVSPVVWFLACAKCPTGLKPSIQTSQYRLTLNPEFRGQLAAASNSKGS